MRSSEIETRIGDRVSKGARARTGALLHLHVQEEPANSSDFFCTGGPPATFTETAGDTFADGFVTVDPFCNWMRAAPVSDRAINVFFWAYKGGPFRRASRRCTWRTRETIGARYCF